MAEDDTILGPMYQTALEKEGFKVILVTDGVEIFSQLKNHIPDLIMLDIEMPKKNGLEVLRELKQNKEYKYIHVIILSNRSKEEEIIECNELGANYAVKSNWTVPEMIERIKSLFKV